MGLRAYIMKRILFSVALIFLVITANFAIFILLPGGATARLANPQKLKPEQVEEQLRHFGLLDPPLVRYGKYLQSMLTFQFGYSYYTNEPISYEINSRVITTLTLVVTAEVIAIIIGVLLGVVASAAREGIKRRDKMFDILTSIGAIVTESLPVFWIGMLLLLVFSITLGWFPMAHSFPQEWTLPGRWPTNPLVEFSVRLQHLFLPALTLVILTTGTYFLLTRASMVETLSEDYLVTAKAKGLTRRKVLFKHALKNAALPVLTYVAIQFGFMLSGATLTETVFNYPGLGNWIWRSIDYRDFPAMQAIFYLIALCVIAANFIADLAYGVFDPRIKYE